MIPCGFTTVRYTARQVYDDRKTTQASFGPRSPPSLWPGVF